MHTVNIVSWEAAENLAQQAEIKSTNSFNLSFQNTKALLLCHICLQTIIGFSWWYIFTLAPSNKNQCCMHLRNTLQLKLLWRELRIMWQSLVLCDPCCRVCVVFFCVAVCPTCSVQQMNLGSCCDLSEGEKRRVTASVTGASDRLSMEKLPPKNSHLTPARNKSRSRKTRRGHADCVVWLHLPS